MATAFPPDEFLEEGKLGGNRMTFSLPPAADTGVDHGALHGYISVTRAYNRKCGLPKMQGAWWTRGSRSPGLGADGEGRYDGVLL